MLPPCAFLLLDKRIVQGSLFLYRCEEVPHAHSASPFAPPVRFVVFAFRTVKRAERARDAARRF